MLRVRCRSMPPRPIPSVTRAPPPPGVSRCLILWWQFRVEPQGPSTRRLPHHSPSTRGYPVMWPPTGGTWMVPRWEPVPAWHIRSMQAAVMRCMRAEPRSPIWMETRRRWIRPRSASRLWEQGQLCPSSSPLPVWSCSSVHRWISWLRSQTTIRLQARAGQSRVRIRKVVAPVPVSGSLLPMRENM